MFICAVGPSGAATGGGKLYVNLPTAVREELAAGVAITGGSALAQETRVEGASTSVPPVDATGGRGP